MDHRGRVQAQGGGIEESEAWAQDVPLPVEEGHERLDVLREKLAPREQEMRADAFVSAHEFIDRAARDGGATAGTSKSYPTRPRRDKRRVDVVVIKGVAFVLPSTR